MNGDVVKNQEELQGRFTEFELYDTLQFKVKLWFQVSSVVVVELFNFQYAIVFESGLRQNSGVIELLCTTIIVLSCATANAVK